ncbi:MAG: glycosyltransferase [Ferruginibacter sp.]
MKPKILIFINTLGFGGAERVVSQLLFHLQDDFEIHIVLLTRIIDYEIPKNIKVFDLNQPFSENAIITLIKLPLLSAKLKRYCETNNIPTVISFLNRPCYISGFMRGLLGFKGRIIMCERTHQSTLFENDTLHYKTVSTALIKYAYNKADLVLSNSIVMKDDLIENFNIKVPMDVIYNPIDIAAVQAKSMEDVNFKFDKNSFYFISVGGFRKEKNHALLLEAMAFMKGTNAKLIFVGGGELQNS